MTPPDPLGGIRARGIRRSFGPVHAVQGIDLDAPPGQVTALVGPNGAGKTTALLVLATLLTPDAGEVSVAGFDPVTQADQVRARMGWSPDVFGLYDTLTCQEYLEVMAAAYRLPAGVRTARAEQLLALARLPYADAPVHTLSRGQKQRLGLARALVHDPSVLLLDEPASGSRPAQPGRAARPAAPAGVRGPGRAGVQPHPVRPGGGRRRSRRSRSTATGSAARWPRCR
jgi:ABC-type multidrug transport system ATPase subunit